MQSLLGLRTGKNHRDGCLQDVHWPAGLFGYFPTYTLGALTAAQLFRAMVEQNPGARDGIGAGEFSAMNGWLREKVWSLGSLYDTAELVERATGAPLGTAAFRDHLEQRYLAS
jgi:carboxypeptidase Taq